jgi:hypothetical protein
MDGGDFALIPCAAAAGYEDPQDVVYRFRDAIGKYFEAEL